MSETSTIQIPILIDNNKNEKRRYFDKGRHHKWVSKAPTETFPSFWRRAGAEFGLTPASDFGRERKKARNYWKMFITDEMINK